MNEGVLNLRAGDDVVSVIKLNKPYDMLVDLSKISLGRELPSVLELFNLIINETEHFTLMCHELEAIRTYTPADKALVVL